MSSYPYIALMRPQKALWVPSETVPVDVAPVGTAPVEAAPVEAAPVEAVPVEEDAEASILHLVLAAEAAEAAEVAGVDVAEAAEVAEVADVTVAAVDSAWDMTWTKARLLEVAAVKGLAVGLINTKAEILAALKAAE